MEIKTKSSNVNGIDVTLTTPTSDFKWTVQNLYQRSIMYEYNTSKVVSRGFDKFFNQHEAEDIIPPLCLENCELREKIDGSLLIVTNINGQLNFRTRGTTDVLDAYPHSKSEIEKFQCDYQRMFQDILWDNGEHSFLFEWTTPSNVIVIDYGITPKIKLIGIVKNSIITEYCNQLELDFYAEKWNIERPKKYKVETPKDVIKLMSIENIEGYVVYDNTNNQQTFKKIKTDEYLHRHRMRSNFNFNFVLNKWLEGETTVENANKMYDSFKKEYDYETISNPLIWKKWNTKIDETISMLSIIDDIYPIIYNEDKKTFAYNVMNSDTSWSGLIKTLLFMRYKFKDNEEKFKQETAKIIFKTKE